MKSETQEMCDIDKRLFVVTDNTKCRWLSFVSRGAHKRPLDVYVLTLGITPEYFRSVNSKKRLPLGRCSFINVDDMSEEVQKDVGEFYINLIFRITKETPEEIFFCSHKNLKWFLEIFEKCPVRSRIINRLFYLELTRRVAARNKFENICIDIDDTPLAETLFGWKGGYFKNIFGVRPPRIKNALSKSVLSFISRYLKSCVGIYLLFLGRSIMLKTCGIGGAEPPAKDAIFFYTNYPFYWNNAYGDKAAEKFFSIVPKNLMQDHPVFYASWLFSLHPPKILSKMGYLKRFFVENNMVVLERLLKAREKSDILSFDYLRWALSVRRYFNRRVEYKYGGFDITALVYHEICRSLTHMELFNDILIETAFKKLVNKHQPTAVIYRIEFQPFENAILSGVRRKCKTIAFQHSTPSRNRLSHFFALDEIITDVKEDSPRTSRPLPHIIFSTGKYFRDIMVKAGFPQNRIEICGPVRYCGLVSYLRQNRNTAEIRKQLGFGESERIFLVATGWFEEEAMALACSLVEANKGLDGKFRFIFRGHPHMRYDKSISKFLNRARPNFAYSFLGDEVPLYDAVSISDGMIQVATTLGYEAMALGKVPVVYENRHIFNFHSSEELRGAVPITSSSEELRDAMRAIVNGDEEVNRMRRLWPDVLEKFFYDLTHDPRQAFAELLKKHSILR